MMKFLVAIFLIFCISSSFAENLCGPFGMSFDNSKCLCAAYTSPSEDGLSCVDGQGTCAPPADLYVSKDKSYTLKARARSLHFVGQNLQVVVEFPSIETALTDITIYNKTQQEVSSLGKSVSDTTLGTWTHGVDNTSACVQIATWTVEWAQLSALVGISEEGHFAFDISVSSHIVREKSPLTIRSVDIAPSILVDVIPVKINLNEIVSTHNFTDRVELILDYDVKVKYYLKKVHLDPATLKMRIVLEHKISFPLSLKSDHLVVKLGDAVLPSRSYEKVNKQDCPATKGSKCLARTIILLHLPTNINCTRLQLDIGLDLVTKCHGINDHTSKYLCSGLRKSLSRKFVHVDIPIKYNFCPTVEATEVSVTDFTLVQGTNTLIAQEILERDVPLIGNITLKVDESFAGSVFTMARISSIKLVEAGSNPASYEILESSSVTDGVFNNNQIFISFAYVPSYQQITTYLQNWANQFFIEVTVDVSFYSPQGISKKTANSPIHTSVRLQIPNHGLPKYLKRDSIFASSPNLRLSESGVKKTLEEHQLTQQKFRTDKMSEETKDLQKTNQTMITLIIASVAACFVVLIVAAVVIYKLRKNSQQTTQI